LNSISQSNKNANTEQGTNRKNPTGLWHFSPNLWRTHSRVNAKCPNAIWIIVHHCQNELLSEWIIVSFLYYSFITRKSWSLCFLYIQIKFPTMNKWTWMMSFAIKSMADTADNLPPLVSKQVHSKYAIRDILPPISKSGNPLKATCSSSHLLYLTRTWDQGNKSVRQRILQEFIKDNKNKTGPQLEKELNNGASLFLTRITAWLRLTYNLDF